VLPAFLESEYAPVAPEKALFHVIPAPLERSVSYGAGCARGPAAILEASQQLEAWDGLSCPGRLGIHTAPPVDCGGTVEDALQRIEESVAAVLEHRALPVLLGGEHSVSLGALRAAKRRHGPFGVIHIDAHADLRPRYQDSVYSHACVMHRALADLDLRLAQFGVRELCPEETQIRRKFGVHFHDAPALVRRGVPDEPLPGDFPRRVYLSFDVDGLDPSLIPATGTPVPGGLGWYEALDIVERCLSGREILGFDITELAPLPGLHAPDFAAARLTYHIMGIIERHALLPR
jgi:agmatinase